jgi:hypothetical protein
MDWNRFVRIWAVVPLVLLHLPPAAFAQEVNEDYIVYQLGPAAEAMQWAGVDGSPESSPAIIEIAQRWGIEPAYWVSVSEVRMLVRAEYEDRDARSRQASLLDPAQYYPFRLSLARFGVMAAGAISCAQAKEKAILAQRLADSLSRVSQLNGAGAGLMGVISGGALRFAGPLGFATLVTGFASAWAGQLAAGYRNAPCMAGGQLWRFRPNVLKASLSRDPSRTPDSSSGPHGWRRVAWPTGATSTRPAPGSRYFCRLVSGRLRSS